MNIHENAITKIYHQAWGLPSEVLTEEEASALYDLLLDLTYCLDDSAQEYLLDVKSLISEVTQTVKVVHE